MRRSRYKPETVRIPLSLPCPHCGDRMTLRLIEPNLPGYDERTFKCLDCSFEEKIIVRIE
jgi:hypothetical protein